MNENEADRRYALGLLNSSLNMARNTGDWDAQGAYAYALRAVEQHDALVAALEAAEDLPTEMEWRGIRFAIPEVEEYLRTVRSALKAAKGGE